MTNLVSTNINDISPAPWDRHGWTGELVSVGGCSATDFKEEDVDEVLRFVSTPRDWDGDTAGLIRLKDGRFVAWEADWGPTGDGFCCDAYGGTADIVFAHTPEEALARLTENGRALLDWPAPKSA